MDSYRKYFCAEFKADDEDVVYHVRGEAWIDDPSSSCEDVAMFRGVIRISEIEGYRDAGTYWSDEMVSDRMRASLGYRIRHKLESALLMGGWTNNSDDSKTDDCFVVYNVIGI